MKHHLLIPVLALMAGGMASQAKTVSNYSFDFNTPIDTSIHEFRPGSNWKHIVDSYNDGYSDYYVSYSYKESDGVAGSGCLQVSEQKAGDNYDNKETYDMVVTPELKGHVEIQLKKSGNIGSPFCEFYAVDASGNTYGTSLKRITSTKLAKGDWITVDLDLEDFTRVGIRGQYVLMDDLTASEADIETEYSMAFVSVVPENTTGVIYHNQNAQGDIELKYTVSVKNTCNSPLIARKTGVTGTRNYSISIIGKNNAPFGAPVYVPVDLQPGETSEPFEVKVIVPNDEISEWWSYSSQTITMNLKENLQGNIIQRANAGYKAYEPKFLLREAGSTSTSSITRDIRLGVLTADNTTELEIANDGTAPLTIKGITLPEGFSSTVALGESLVEPGTVLSLPITISADKIGFNSGHLVVNYLDAKGAERSSTIYFAATMAPVNSWTADFNGASGGVKFPQGSVAEAGIQSKYDGLTGLNKYDVFLNSYTNSDYKEANNKFITPILTIGSNGKLYFSAAKDQTEGEYYIKVYTSSDRKNWGEPIVAIESNNEALADGKFHGYELDLPAGDTYVAFAVYGMRLDDIAVTGTQKEVAHDLYLVSFSQTEKTQSGRRISASAEVIPLTNEAAADYTVKYYLGDEEIAQIASSALTSSANVKKKFSTSVTKEVEATTVLPGKIVFEFTDGTRFETETLDLTLTNEPGFVFNTPGISDSTNIPSSINNAIDFGKTNTLGQSKEYEIFNWGTAPLEVTSITAPDGFSVSVDQVTLPGKQRQPLTLTFSTETPGNYSGNLTFTYNNGTESVEYSVPVKGILLDPEKWYVTFDNAAHEPVWPAGSLALKNVKLENSSMPANHFLTSNAKLEKEENMLISPLLAAKAGEKLTFDIALHNLNWATEGGMKVFIANNREDLIDYTRHEKLDSIVFDANSVKDLSTAFTTCEITFEKAGNYYIGFNPYEYLHVDEIYGLTPVAVDADLLIEGAEISRTATQNIPANGYVKVRNLLATMPEGTYTVTGYVDGKASVSALGSVAISQANHVSTEAALVPVAFRSPKVGTFPVYLEIKAGNVTYTTEPVNVTFAEETLSAEVVVGTPQETKNDTPLNLYYKNSESVSLFTPAVLGLSGGEKISSLAIKGYGKKEFTTTLAVYMQWTDDLTQSQPSSSDAYVTAGMSKLYDGKFTWKNTNSEIEDMIVFNFPTPIVYPANKSLRLVVTSTNDSDSGSSANFGFQVSDLKNCTYKHQNDGTEGVFTGSWSAVSSPVLYLGLDVEPRSISGKVYDADNNPVAGASVTAISNDGDNVQYTTATDQTGAYQLNVIQSAREYDIEVAAAGQEEFENGISVADDSITDFDFTLLPVIRVSDTGDHTSAPDNAVIYVEKALNPGFNAVALPISLTGEEVAAIFGEDVTVMEFDAVTTDGAATVVNFAEVKDFAMEAGKPYLLYIEEESREAYFRTKGALSPLKTETSERTDFLATDRVTPVADKMFVLDSDNFMNAARSRAVSEIPAYSGYIKALDATSVSFTTDANVNTSIEEVEISEESEQTIYDLNGLRVRNPQKGIYIINGKAVIVK